MSVEERKKHLQETIKKVADEFSEAKLKELINKWSEYLNKFELYPSIQTNETLSAQNKLWILQDALTLKIQVVK